MRIALIAPPWLTVPPRAYGGTEQVLDVLAREIHAAGHEVLLFTTGDSRCPVPRRWVLAEAVGTAVMSPGMELRHVVAAYDEIETWGADVVHDHTLAGPIYSRRFDVPVVTTNHGPFDGELGPLYRAMGDDVAIIAISHAQAAGAHGIPIAAVIHHGVDVDAHPPGPGTGGYALFLGRMNAAKGVDVAIVAARRAGIPLRIAAKMAELPEQQYFDTVVRPLLGGDVEYVGEVGGDDKRTLLGDARCLLNPIRWSEPFGMVMVEALAAGTPVVATPCGAVPEIVDDGVTGFVRADAAGLADALGRVDELDRDACRAAAVARFSGRRMAAAHLELYAAVRAAPIPSGPWSSR